MPSKGSKSKSDKRTIQINVSLAKKVASAIQKKKDYKNKKKK